MIAMPQELNYTADDTPAMPLTARGQAHFGGFFTGPMPATPSLGMPGNLLYTVANNTRPASEGLDLSCAPRRVAFFRPETQNSRPTPQPPFQPYPEFKKADLDERQALYQRIAEEIWDVQRLRAEVTE
ncbi:MAG: hypothetical protein D6712_15045 [Chloroflexi bacterium]|nr:MAG: hypothetical protein D6712_15045 [Chloroflexota bacterium]